MKKLLNIDLHLYIFAIIGIRIAIVGAGIGDAIALAAVAGLYGYKNYLDTKKEKTLDETVRAELDSMKASLSAAAMKHVSKQPLDVSKLRF